MTTRAQIDAAERSYWYAADPVEQKRRRDEEAAHRLWYRGLLGITSEAVDGRDVLDIGGGPCPIVADQSLSLGTRVVVDPMDVDETIDPTPPNVVRIKKYAETLSLSVKFDEVWVYNVLQHVTSPSLVVETVQRHAAHTVRWFEWINTPLSVVHPHSIDKAFLFGAFQGFNIVRCVHGTAMAPTWEQEFLALVGVRC